MVSIMTDAEQKSYENEGGLHSKEVEPKNPNHGGKREGAGRPFGSKSKPCLLYTSDAADE